MPTEKHLKFFGFLVFSEKKNKKVGQKRVTKAFPNMQTFA